MPRRLHLGPHLSHGDLEARYRAATGPAATSSSGAVGTSSGSWWLLAEGMTAAAVAGVAGYSAYRIGQVARRDNREGPDGVRDRRRRYRGSRSGVPAADAAA